MFELQALNQKTLVLLNDGEIHQNYSDLLPRATRVTLIFYFSLPSEEFRCLEATQRPATV